MRPKEVLQKFVDAFNQADAETLSLLYAEDAVNHQVANEPVHGRDNIKRFWRMNLHKQDGCICGEYI